MTAPVPISRTLFPMGDDMLEVRHTKALVTLLGRELLDAIKARSTQLSPLGNENARAQVGTNGGLSQRWRNAEFERRAKAKVHKGSDVPVRMLTEQEITISACADELDAAKLRLEEAVKALPAWPGSDCDVDGYLVAQEAVLKIIREIL